MTVYIEKTEGKELCSDALCTDSQPMLAIVNADEFQEKQKKLSRYQELASGLHSIRFCKAEIFRDCMLGTLRIPQKSESRRPELLAGFYMTEESLFFVEETGELKNRIEKHMDRFQDPQSPDQLLLRVIELLIENDILYLLQFEKEMEEMENRLIQGNYKNFFAENTRYRQKFSELNAYYEQLTAVGDLVQSHESSSLIKNMELWDRYTLRTERLHNHVHYLQENVLQLRELYQSKQDAWQNNVMCMLTVVTTLFLPLTLLTGWYGMNFAYMPELHWKYGYLAVIAAAILIITLEIVYFKRKKFL